MRVFVSVDMEGTTGLERLEEIFRGLPGFDKFRQLMAGDANAVIQGAIDAGATEIVVSDSHGYMCNIHPDDLYPGVQLRRGQLRRQWCQMKGFDGNFDAFIMTGFHAKAGTTDAILAHTWITGFRDVRINGHSVPEPSLNGLLAGAFGVPVVMLGADDRGIEESKPILGEIPYAATKTSLGFTKGNHLPIDRSRELLRRTAKEGVQSAKKIKPLSCELPVTIELDLSPDSLNDPALAARPDDNMRFFDGPLSSETVMSDFELVMRTHPKVTSPKDGTVAITAEDFPSAYKTLHSILAEIYERDIENLVDLVADVESYDRPDLDNLLGTDYPLNEIGPRRKAGA